MDKLTYVEWDNCSTIIVGKNASATGRVLLAHGEDDLDCVSQIHIVPPRDHKEGEMLTFDDSDARVPQVPHTYGYYWSEMRSPRGEPFADGYMNENGVVVVSNSCVSTKKSDSFHGQGLGYGLRGLIAQRCKSAREGVRVAARLLDKFGYRRTRSYRICDKDEGWILQATEGNQYAARRVGDDEVLYIPNWLTIHEIDFSDTEHKNYFWSPGIVEYAVRNGWMKEGDAFDFAEVYQGEGSFVVSNTDRHFLRWKQLVGEENIPEYHTFSVKADRKYRPEDLKKILRSHYAAHEEDIKKDPSVSPHRLGICRDTTVESLVVEFEEEADLTTMWRANLRPCTNPFMPWFAGVLRSPKGWEWIPADASLKTHFFTDPTEFMYHDDRAYWAFHMLAFTMEYDYRYCEGVVKEGIEKLEKEWAVTVPAIKEAYRKIAPADREYAKALLTDFVCAQAEKTVEFAKQTTLRLANKKDKDNRNYWRGLMFGK